MTDRFTKDGEYITNPELERLVAGPGGLTVAEMRMLYNSASQEVGKLRPLDERRKTAIRDLVEEVRQLQHELDTRPVLYHTARKAKGQTAQPDPLVMVALVDQLADLHKRVNSLERQVGVLHIATGILLEAVAPEANEEEPKDRGAPYPDPQDQPARDLATQRLHTRQPLKIRVGGAR